MIKLQIVSDEQKDRLLNLGYADQDYMPYKVKYPEILLALRWAWDTYGVHGSVYPAGQPLGYKVMSMRGAYPKCVVRNKVHRDVWPCDPYDLAEQECLDAVLTHLEQLKDKNKLKPI